MPTADGYPVAVAPMEVLVRLVVFVLGLALVARTMLGAVRAPAPAAWLQRPRSHASRSASSAGSSTPRSHPASRTCLRDRVLAYYAPTALLVVLVYWLVLVAIGYAAMYWAIGAGAGIGTPPGGGRPHP